jgi:anti-sigma B factor antagonist
MPGLLDVTLQRDGNWCLLTVVGELDLDTVAGFDDALSPVLSDASVAGLVVDLTGLRFISSVGLRSLAEMSGGTNAASFRIVVKPHTPVRRVFDANGLNQMLPLYPTVSAAVAARRR